MIWLHTPPPITLHPHDFGVSVRYGRCAVCPIVGTSGLASAYDAPGLILFVLGVVKHTLAQSSDQALIVLRVFHLTDLRLELVYPGRAHTKRRPIPNVDFGDILVRPDFRALTFGDTFGFGLVAYHAPFVAASRAVADPYRV